MSYSQCFLHSFMDMGSVFVTIAGTILKYNRHPWSLGKPNVETSSYGCHEGFGAFINVIWGPGLTKILKYREFRAHASPFRA